MILWILIELLEGIFCGLFKKLNNCKELSQKWLEVRLMIVRMYGLKGQKR